VEYTDYPYARFDIHLDPVQYTNEEYQRYLVCTTWSKSETDMLMDLARKYELRWPVIYDRWIGEYDNPQDVPSDRQIEDLQHRYYQVAALMAQSRISHQAALEVQSLTSGLDLSMNDSKQYAENILLETAAARSLASSDPQDQPLIANLGTGSTNKVFDLQQERKRRAYMEAMWNRTREEEQEEADLRQELKQVEAQLRRLKKQGGHILAAAASGSNAGNRSTPSSRNPSRSVSPVPGSDVGPTHSAAFLDQAIASTAPVPTPGFPYLQSGRLALPAAGGPNGINKSLLNRMETVLTELKVPARPIPTKRVCDLHDNVRKDALTLLVLQKNLLQKEGLVESKRLRLAKMGGNVRVVQEETLLGIAPASPPPTPAATVVASPTPVTAATAAAAAAAAAVAAVATSATASNATAAAAVIPSVLPNKPKTKPAKSKSTGGKAVRTEKVKIEEVVAASSPAASVKDVPVVSLPATTVSPTTVSANASATLPATTVVSAASATVTTPTAGSKSTKKAAPKRKRKSEAKSPVAAGAVATAGASVIDGANPPAAAAAAAAKPAEAITDKSPGKKRPRKAGSAFTG
jgi:DNA methyltransferase 1-associated protein 1